MTKTKNKRGAKVKIQPPVGEAMNCGAMLTIATAHKLRDGLLDSLAVNNLIVADTSEATDADLTGLQTLYAAWRYASEHGKTLVIRAPESGIVREKAKSAGSPFVEMLESGVVI